MAILLKSQQLLAGIPPKKHVIPLGVTYRLPFSQLPIYEVLHLVNKQIILDKNSGPQRFKLYPRETTVRP